MSSDLDRDTVDYLEDTAEHEDETLFLPCPPAGPDSWLTYNGGILMGFAGGALVMVAPWLGGLLIFAGYGLAALTLKAPGNRFVRAIRFGYALCAVLGAALVASEIFAPAATLRVFAMPAKRHLFFAGVIVMPLAIGVLRYVIALVRREKRRA